MHDFFNMDKDYEAPQLLAESNSCPPSPSCEPNFSFHLQDDWSFEQSMIPLSNTDHEASVQKEPTSPEKKPTKFFKEESGEKKQRKDVFKVLTEDDVRKQIRVERNRQFAKESRERKKQYIEHLQAQIRELRRVVDIYRFRMGKYELVEKYSNNLAFDDYFMKIQTFKEQLKNGQSLEAKAHIIEELKETQNNMMKERLQAMETLTKKLLEVILPLQARVALWAAENNIDCEDLEGIDKLLGPNAPIKQFKAMKEHMDTFFDKNGENKILRKKMIESWVRVRTLVNDLVITEKKLQWEVKKINLNINSKMVPKFNQPLLDFAKKFLPVVALRPEMVNYCDSVMNKLDKEVEEKLLKEEATYVGDHDS
eukprot:TRINITY_DN2471_c0_g2_i3.p1 TRINITY_DN2471_c0_g2~~TRINITY_DN2471_c0_g2_i3.p1  ORF type:complete len:367 (+),score=70.29 TRINITY_DN2471_c0_g2_i3:158-1258(+)